MQKGEVVKKGEKIQSEGGRVEVIAKYFLLLMLFSFLGWAFETVITRLQTGKFYDRGFMYMPFCPIYGVSLIIVYFLLGTPNEGRGLLKNEENPVKRQLLYLPFAFFIPTAAELLVGFFFDALFGVSLWSYSGLPLNFRGYISLPISLGWMALVFLFMKYLFSPFKTLVFKTPKGVAIGLSSLLFIALVADMAASYLAI